MKNPCEGALLLQIPLIGWIGRLDHQKGPDIVLDAVPGFAARSCQVRLPCTAAACQPALLLAVILAAHEWLASVRYSRALPSMSPIAIASLIGMASLREECLSGTLDRCGNAARSWSCWAAGTRSMRQPCGNMRRTTHSTSGAGSASPSRWLTGSWQVCRQRRCPLCPLMSTINPFVLSHSREPQ